MTIKQLCKQAHQTAIEKGFWDKGICNLGYACDGCPISNRCPYDRNKSELLMLIVSELGECCEGLRKGNPKSNHIPKFSFAEEELADVMIRIGDMAQACGYRLEEAIRAKLEYNKTRPQKHGKEF